MFPMSRNVPVAAGSCLLVPQNGVTGCRKVASYSFTGNHNEPSKRPGSLGSSGGFAARAFQDTDDEIDEGSLPCTPEQTPDGVLDGVLGASGCAAADGAALDSDTAELIFQVLQDYTGLSRPRRTHSKALPTMMRVVRGVVEKHRYVYNGFINKLSQNDQGDDVSFVSTVAQSLFADGVTNWGRIASLVAFGAVVCQHLKEQQREHCVELVGHEISTYLLSQQRDWLLKNNSWDGFMDFFRVSDPETTVMKSLMAFAGFAGIGATLALFIR